MATDITNTIVRTMTAPNRPPAEYKAVAEFLKYIGLKEVDATWAQNTGYVPVTELPAPVPDRVMAVTTWAVKVVRPSALVEDWSAVTPVLPDVVLV